MKKSEVAMLFAVIVFYDQRIQFDEGKLEAWHLALDDDMPFEYGRKIIVDYYSENTSAIMPANLNEKWRSHRRYVRELDLQEKNRNRLESEQNKAVPIPPDIKAKLLATLGISAKDDSALAVECDFCEAPIGKRCKTPNGIEFTVGVAHPSRYEKAKDATVEENQRKDSSQL